MLAFKGNEYMSTMTASTAENFYRLLFTFIDAFRQVNYQCEGYTLPRIVSHNPCNHLLPILIGSNAPP